MYEYSFSSEYSGSFIDGNRIEEKTIKTEKKKTKKWSNKKSKFTIYSRDGKNKKKVQGNRNNKGKYVVIYTNIQGSKKNTRKKTISEKEVKDLLKNNSLLIKKKSKKKSRK
tara:strand:- start:94 stop:426 length:333 start_codon:yes stop_codon:yes gene_type:complete